VGHTHCAAQYQQIANKQTNKQPNDIRRDYFTVGSILRSGEGVIYLLLRLFFFVENGSSKKRNDL